MRAAGYEEVVLWVFEANQRARAFYERQGFAPAGPQQQAHGAVEMMYKRAL